MVASLPFREFDESGEVRIYYHGILPHWRQTGCTYFVTYRLGDSLPAPVIREFEHERNQWLLHRGIDPIQLKGGVNSWKKTIGLLSISDQRLYEQTMATKLNQYLDAGHGSCILKQMELAKVVADSLTHFNQQRVITGDYVVMPNHVHALMRPMSGFELEDILQAIKSYTATKINQKLGVSGQCWMRESYDHLVRDQEQLEAFQKYIRANPSKANLQQNEFQLRTASYYLE